MLIAILNIQQVFSKIEKLIYFGKRDIGDSFYKHPIQNC